MTLRITEDRLTWHRNDLGNLPGQEGSVTKLLQIYTGNGRVPALLPSYVRGMFRGVGSDSILFERPPEKRVMHYAPRGRRRGVVHTTAYEVQLPWMYFLIQLNHSGGEPSIGSVYVGCSDHSLTSLSDPTVVPPIPNLYADGRICFSNADPNVMLRNNRQQPTVDAIISAVVSCFYDGTANSDLHLYDIPSRFHESILGRRRDRSLDPNAEWETWLARWETMSFQQVMDWANPAQYDTTTRFDHILVNYFGVEEHAPANLQTSVVESHIFTLGQHSRAF